MLKIGLDIGTGFVKCVCNYGSFSFPSVYVRQVHGNWTQKTTEAVGTRAQSIMNALGTTAISPIRKGKPDSRYQKETELLLNETMKQINELVKDPMGSDEKICMVVGLPYHAFAYQDVMTRTIKKAFRAKKCTAVAQASGTLMDLNQKSAIVVSIGQGTTEIVVIDDLEVIDGDSSSWASGFVTRKISKFAHLDTATLHQNASLCKRYSKIMAKNLILEIREMSAQYDDRYSIALSGGGMLLPGMNQELLDGLKDFTLLIPDDPVMSNAKGLYKLVE